MSERPEQLDRPVSLPPRTAPQPAPNLRDPIDLTTPAPAALPTLGGTLVVAVTPQPKEATEPLNTRVAQSVAALARQAAKDNGLSLRQVVEAAILTRWGN